MHEWGLSQLIKALHSYKGIITCIYLPQISYRRKLTLKYKLQLHIGYIRPGIYYLFISRNRVSVLYKLYLMPRYSLNFVSSILQPSAGSDTQASCLEPSTSLRLTVIFDPNIFHLLCYLD
jgi:hypothetical protein